MSDDAENTVFINVPGKEGHLLKPGDIVGDNYHLLVLVGEGGMGIVFRCWHRIIDREYALKILKPDQVNETSWQRFQVEARSIAKLDHLNIVKIFNMGVDRSGCPYYVMELLDGTSLEDYITSESYDLDFSLDVFRQLTEGFSYAHSKAIIHRDIKPANIILENLNTGIPLVKIVDFGLAKLMQREALMKQGLTAAGEVFGTPLYMSPEQSQGIDVDHRSDIYSLGCTFFRTLTGSFPYCGANAIETVMMHQNDPIPTLASVSETHFPEGLEEVIGRMLAKKPQDRYQSMADVGHDIDRLRQGKSVLKISPKRENQPDQQYSVDKKGSPVQTALILIVCSVLAGAALVSILGTGKTPAPIKLADNIKSVGEANISGSPLPAIDEKKMEVQDLNKAVQDFKKFRPKTSFVPKDGLIFTFYFPQTAVGRLQNLRGASVEAKGAAQLRAIPPIVLQIDRQRDSGTWANPSILEKLDKGQLNGLSLDQELFNVNAHFNKVQHNSDNATAIEMIKIARQWDLFTHIGLISFSMDDKLWKAIEESKNVVSLNLQNCKADGNDLIHFSFLPRMDSLMMTGVDNIDSVLRKIKSSKVIRNLAISNSKPTLFSILGLIQCKSLTDLHYQNCDIDDSKLEAISRIPNLELLDLRKSRYSSEFLTRCKGFKKLKKLFFTDETMEGNQILSFGASHQNCLLNNVSYQQLPKKLGKRN